MGIYPQHVPLITKMVPGELIVRKDGRDLFIATGEGLIEVTANRVAVLTDLAIPADRIDEAKAEEARQRAEARLREKLSDKEVASVNASLARSLAQLRVNAGAMSDPGRESGSPGRARPHRARLLCEVPPCGKPCVRVRLDIGGKHLQSVARPLEAA
jgi:F-type H+-transporting ATPase subunit epsilon